jgi:peptidoglycan/LPS O-acetylase OafA/YrhL
VSGVQRVTGMIGDISTAATEQSATIAEVHRAANHLDEMTQQNSALVEEAGAAATSMRELAGSLMTVVDAFRVGAIRIIPIYWLLTTVQMLYLVWATSIGDVTASSRVADWSSFLRSLFFIPYLNGVGTHRPVLAQGWTLNYEMFFYLVFALCLATAKKAAPLVCIGLMLALYGLGRAFVIPAPVGLLADDFLLSFAVGIAIGLVRLRVMPVVPRGAVIPGVVALVLLGNYGAGYITHGSTSAAASPLRGP